MKLQSPDRRLYAETLRNKRFEKRKYFMRLKPKTQGTRTATRFSTARSPNATPPSVRNDAQNLRCVKQR